jgi:hypothetical protein
MEGASSAPLVLRGVVLTMLVLGPGGCVDSVQKVLAGNP